MIQRELICAYKVKLYQLMIEKARNQRRNQARFNYSTQLSNNDDTSLNLHHKYFKLYERYSGQPTDIHSLSEPNSTHNDTNSLHIDPSSKDKSIIKELQYQNKVLKQQLVQSEEAINIIKSEFYYCKAQLDKISKMTKIQTYDHQNTTKDLKEEIQIILEKNRNSQREIRKLKDIIRDLNQDQLKSTYQLSQVRLYNRSRSLGRPSLSHTYSDIGNNLTSKERKENKGDKEGESNKKFISGLKQMYAKIMNFKAASLKELWRWLKDIGQMFHRLKKWRKQCRTQLKESKKLTSERLIDLLNDVMILIN